MKVLILGCGLVGKAIALDLVKEPGLEITVTDYSKEALNGLREQLGLKTFKIDLSDDRTVFQLVQDYDLVIGALPGFMGYSTLKTVIEAGKNIVDISFFPEDPFQLDELARRKGVVAIMDCGIAPGFCNVLMGYLDRELDEVDSYLCYVGGLPVVREWPYQYKIVFSPVDVIEEYTRPARYIQFGRMVTQPALSDPEMLHFTNVGTLEAFNTDGLRSLMKTMKAPSMKEKTLRYPGHIELMRVFRESGFFSKDPVNFKNHEIIPLEFISTLLFPQWELKSGEHDITVMKVIIEGKKDGKKLRFIYNMLDHYDKETDTTSMARTTGYTCTVTARMVIQGSYTRVGISPPEYLGQEPNCFRFIREGLAKRNIIFEETVTEIED
ncbi:saccharopine dehydrogenase family protein [bacterium]|nr:saccharopine dehydrogenase family protein [bacterium]